MLFMYKRTNNLVMSVTGHKAVTLQLTFPSLIGISTTVMVGFITHTFQSSNGNQQRSKP